MMLRLSPVLVVLLLTLWPSAPAGQAASLVLSQNDHIAIVGNTLAERMQNDGWLETMVQARFPKHSLVFRNLGFSGDEIGIRFRSKNFGTPDEWLSAAPAPIGGYQENRLEGINTRADVVFAFFGYNESYAGEAGLAVFRQQLGDWLTHTLAQRYNGKTAPRVVLFSPIAHEDLGSADLPDGRENNARLQMYSRAMGEVARAHGVLFVDLFAPSAALYASTAAPLTINGVHLNAEGNRLIAQAIDRALFVGEIRHDPARLERLRAAIVDKDFYWFHRYRTPNGYSTYGDRAFLTFVRGNPRNVNPNQIAGVASTDILPSNYEVMQRELPILDVMTRNRDRRIWAIARGENIPASVPVDDSETPPAIDARTNLPKVSPFLSGPESIARITAGAGLSVELFASEEQFPDLVNPVQMAFDTKGRLWVASWKSYPQWQPKTPMDDKLLILEDTDGDGRADKRTVFAGDLENPTGFEFWNGGVILASQPNLVFLRDTNGDDRYDTKEILLHGFDSADSHHAINSFTFDPGGALYMQEGIFHRTQVETPWGPVVRQADGGVYRFEPKTWKFETFIPMNFPNPHGHVFDGWGRDIVFDATGGQPYYGPSFSTKKYYPAMESTRAPKPGNVRVRPVGGAELLSSRHFPESMQGNLVVLNTIGFRGLLNYDLSEDGAGLKSVEAEPILQSADENFRPVDAEVGPDGALYFLDWHNPVIGHMQHNLRDTSRDKTHGRVYRVRATGRPLLTPSRIAGEPIPALLDLLKSPEDRVRYRTKIELSSRPTRDVMSALGLWMQRLDAADPQYEHQMMEALWLHQWHNVANDQLLGRMLRSRDPWARAAATRVLCYWRDRVSNPLALLKVQVNDGHPAVRLEAVRAASFFQTIDAAEVALASLEHPQDRFLEYTLDQTMRTLQGVMARTNGPRILLNQPALAVDYQLNRLGNDDLSGLDRRDDDVRFRPVYLAMLTRRGLAPALRDESLAALVKMDRSSVTEVLLQALPKVAADDEQTSGRLLTLLFAQPGDELRRNRELLAKGMQGASSPAALSAAYGGLLLVDGDTSLAWQTAVDRGQLPMLLRSLAYLPESARPLRESLFAEVSEAVEDAPDVVVRSAAVAALPWTRRDETAFRVLAGEITAVADAGPRAAAIRALPLIPPASWPADQIEPLARRVVALVRETPEARRADADALAAIELGNTLAKALPSDTGGAIRRELRSLGIQVIRIAAVPEALRFNLSWFAVEAGRPMRIVFSNPDAMPHNVVVGRPGSLETIGKAGSAMPMPSDPAAKPFVPDSPLVLQATGLVNFEETATLSFLAPKEPGEYPYVCTFPGHWLRMYGVMVVVSDLEQWERLPTVPLDPLTGQQFAADR